jgi:hypothetical protein
MWNTLEKLRCPRENDLQMLGKPHIGPLVYRRAQTTPQCSAKMNLYSIDHHGYNILHMYIYICDYVCIADDTSFCALMTNIS